MSDNTLTLILRFLLIIMNFLKDSGQLDDVTDDELKKGMQDVKDSVAKWNK